MELSRIHWTFDGFALPLPGKSDVKKKVLSPT
jgi:hypothetical protein